MEIKGKVVASLGVQKGTSKAGREWSKATIIIETEGQYPKKVALDNLKDADNFSRISVGSTGVFHIEVESREYNSRWFTSVNCWKWEVEQTAPAVAPQSSTPYLDSVGVTGRKHVQAAPATPQGGDDLPF